MHLSYDVAVFDGKTSRDHTCNNTLVRRRNVIDNVRVNSACLFEIMIILKAIKSHLKGHMINRIFTFVVFAYEIYETRRRLVS